MRQRALPGPRLPDRRVDPVPGQPGPAAEGPTRERWSAFRQQVHPNMLSPQAPTAWGSPQLREGQGGSGPGLSGAGTETQSILDGHALTTPAVPTPPQPKLPVRTHAGAAV